VKDAFMASYIESSLLGGERIEKLGYTSLWFLSPIIIIGILLLPVIIGFAFLIMAYIKYKASVFALTNKRILIKSGLIKKEVIELNILRIESIIVDQTFVGRVLNFGTLVISGAGIFPTRMENISNPMEFKKALLETKI